MRARRAKGDSAARGLQRQTAYPGDFLARSSWRAYLAGLSWTSHAFHEGGVRHDLNSGSLNRVLMDDQTDCSQRADGRRSEKSDGGDVTNFHDVRDWSHTRAC